MLAAANRRSPPLAAAHRRLLPLTAAHHQPPSSSVDDGTFHKGVGAITAGKLTGHAIPVPTLKVWRGVLKPLRGAKLRAAQQELMTRHAGNPNLQPFLTDAEKRAAAEKAKLSKTYGNGMTTQEFGGTYHSVCAAHGPPQRQSSARPRPSAQATPPKPRHDLATPPTSPFLPHLRYALKDGQGRRQRPRQE